MSNPYASLDDDDYTQALLASRPPGIAWPTKPTSTQFRVFNAIGTILAVVHRAMHDLLDRELFPDTTDDMLPEWQAAWGSSTRGTKDAQRGALIAAITDPGGFTAAHYEALAAALGFTITAVATGAFTWTVHAAAALSVDDRQALETLIALKNRATCVVTFTYDL
jgi:uncharacterized protein YmfQ (DUF2313 family)